MDCFFWIITLPDVSSDQTQSIWTNALLKLIKLWCMSLSLRLNLEIRWHSDLKAILCLKSLRTNVLNVKK